MKLLTKVLLFIVTLSAVLSCIALEDEFSPTVSNNIIADKVYYYYDSLHINVMFRDNALIEESNVRISLITSTPSENDTVSFSFDTTYTNVAARLLQFDSTFIVPLHAKTGKYIFESSNKDASDNIIRDTTYFYIDTDTIAPLVTDFSVQSKNEIHQNNNQFCRGDVVIINAFVTENAALKRVGAGIGENEITYFEANGQSTSTATLLQNSFSIPNDLTDGSYQLKFVVEDMFGNSTALSENITILCDNTPAELISFEEESGISVPASFIVPLFPGEEFNLSSLIFEDTGGLDSARLEISRNGTQGDVTETPITFDLEGVTKTDLSTIFDEYFLFSFDKVNAVEGDEISVNVLVKDLNQSWENASSFNFSLIAKKDEAPEIVINHLVINDVPTVVPINEEYDITDLLDENQDLTIALDGVINEEVGLASVKYKFSSDNRNIQSFGRIIDLSDDELSYPVSISDVIGTTFPINDNENLSGKITYSLEIIATDFKEQADTVNFVLSAVY
ncbi:DUF4625 domain-containing protein [Flammeovirga aprica]|uniref:DUF4625 domain-containing protein n=1 Tax=Flammeovirga aprica JL-4 TaxID=694437 RepID=A0A7X9P2Q7_9BACT|nr:DUF4625 domain-containing protein [Flammeovirga aprica]NME68098.1 DUF4625 domain-containing protein [Flammeovirga aprica JL-4]